ncbi:MAG: hypothetical protein C0432_00640 [Candidatus Puniceispirillum sp.]|nr:hypothetical protein [Candidatus Pelagibacter sp.]MBA4282790.1 hypothetical protein [Candidatus Puniceispirillum sp.]
MHQKLDYYAKKAEVTTYNITHAELKGTKRKEVEPFQDILKKSPYKKTSSGVLKDVKEVKISEKNIKHTDQEIRVEMENMNLAHGTVEHDNLVKMLKSFYGMYKAILGR